MKQKIYLDNNATTALAPEVVDAIVSALPIFGNPSSVHSFGREAKALITKTRDTIATFFGVKPAEIIFTSSGTEAINMLLRGLFAETPRGHIITSSVEHAACYNTVKALEQAGCRVTFLDPGRFGAVTPDIIKEIILQDTRLITLMAVNNETGVKTDIEAIAQIAKEKNIPFVVDGVALLGKEKREPIPMGVSAMAFSGHKIHAPKGVGFAFVRKSLKITPYLTGGPQESGRRGGTEDVAAICGLGRAMELMRDQLDESVVRMQQLRDYFEQELLALGDVVINGEGPRVCNTSNLAFLGVEGEALLMRLDLEGLAASHGSACTTGALEPSRILLNMGLSRERAASSLRFSLSRYTTQEEIERAVDCIKETVKKLRRM